MSMGNDYATGMGIAQRNNQTLISGKGVDPAALFNTIMTTRRPMQGHINLTGGKSAEDILNESKMNALKIKAQELENRSAELDMRETELTGAANRERMAAESQAGIDMQRAQTRRIEQDTTNAELKRTGEAAKAEEKDQEGQLMQNAMRGFYTGDVESIRDYFDSFGQPGVSIQDVITASNGQVIVDFGEGKEARFDSPRDAIEKLLVPASLIEKGIAGKMTEAQTVKSKQDQQKIDISGKRATDYGKGISMKGEITPDKEADLKIKIANDIRKNYLREPTQDEIDAAYKNITGKSMKPENKTSAGGEGYEHKMAQKAIDAGFDPVMVKKRFKERTGKDF